MPLSVIVHIILFRSLKTLRELNNYKQYNHASIIYLIIHIIASFFKNIGIARTKSLQTLHYLQSAVSINHSYYCFVF